MATLSYTDRIGELADDRGITTAIVFVDRNGGERTLSWFALLEGLRRAADLLQAMGVQAEQLIAIALPKCEEHFLFMMGAWRIGARPLTLNAGMAPAERDRIIAMIEGRFVVGVSEWTPSVKVEPGRGWSPVGPADQGGALPPTPASNNFAIATGGSTGLPKIILSPFPGAFAPDAVPERDPVGRRRDMVQLVNGPLFHNSPCTLAYSGLLLGHTLIVMEHFDADLAVSLIQRHRVSFIPTVPTVMNRILDSPRLADADLSSIEALFHTGSVCPPSIKEAWMGLIGPERVYEAFGGSELIGTTFIRGDEWLTHRGSVGRPIGADLKILDDDGNEVPTGTIGEIYMRSHAATRYSYVEASAEARRRGDFESHGDLGHVDNDGFVYLADRRVDLIITGGENVYPAEVENAIIEHPGVRDVVVIGLPDPMWGKRVHAIIEPRVEAGAGPPTADELRVHCSERLSAYKVPKDFELVDRLPRDEAGKIRRSALVEGRA